MVVAAGVCVTGCAGKKPQTAEEQVRASAPDLRATLQDTVKDAGRLQQMLAIADRAAADLEAGAAELAKLQKEQDRLNADYNATRDDIQQLGERMQKTCAGRHAPGS